VCTHTCGIAATQPSQPNRIRAHQLVVLLVCILHVSSRESLTYHARVSCTASCFLMRVSHVTSCVSLTASHNPMCVARMRVSHFLTQLHTWLSRPHKSPCVCLTASLDFMRVSLPHVTSYARFARRRCRVFRLTLPCARVSLPHVTSYARSNVSHAGGVGHSATQAQPNSSSLIIGPRGDS
jgi:hypothetical protein